MVDTACVWQSTFRAQPIKSRVFGTLLAACMACFPALQATANSEVSIPTQAVDRIIHHAEAREAESIDISGQAAKRFENRMESLTSERSDEQSGVSPESEGVVPFENRVPRRHAERATSGRIGERATGVSVNRIGPERASERSPDAWRELSFVSGTKTPGYGIDRSLSALVSDASARGLYTLYGFILPDRFLDAEQRTRLESLGVQLLGRHGFHHKAAMPVRQIDTIADLDFIEWIGTSHEDQKIAPELAPIWEDLKGEESSFEEQQIPLLINLFDDDDSSRLKERLQALGVVVGKYHPSIRTYQAVATGDQLGELVKLDFVLFVELITQTGIAHSRSIPMIGGDFIRPGGSGTRYDGSTITLGILDSGFALGSHVDLNKNGCGVNFTDDEAGVWEDESGHGTHVLSTISGTGVGDRRFRGVAPGIGGAGSTRIRAAKIWDSEGLGTVDTWLDGLDFMGQETACNSGSPRPEIVNISGGRGSSSNGTDSRSRLIDSHVWNHRQLYVVSAGNDGPGDSTMRPPAVSKSTLTVGNVQGTSHNNMDVIRDGSSRGPTGDNRFKPNVTAPGTQIWAADASTAEGYTSKTGTSMASPHVAGMAATLMDHNDFFLNRPWVTRARFMATGFLHDDDISLPEINTYGLGRVSAFMNHFGRNNGKGWANYSTSRTIRSDTYGERQIEVPADAERLVVVMTWDEPAASSGDSAARLWDLELRIDVGHTCAPEDEPQCGEYLAYSNVDNVVYQYIDDPSPGTYNIKVVPFSAPDDYSLRAGFVAKVIRGDTQPELDFTVVPSTTRPIVGDEIQVTTSVASSSWVASGVHIQNTWWWGGLPRLDVETTRADDDVISFGASTSGIVMGDTPYDYEKQAVWTYEALYEGCNDLKFRASASNAAEENVEFEVCAGNPPSVPSDLDATQGDEFDQVTVSWQPILKADGYRLYRAQTSGDTGTLIYQGTSTVFEDTNVLPEQSYWYRVRANNDWGESDMSDSVEGWSVERTDEIFQDRFLY